MLMHAEKKKKHLSGIERDNSSSGISGMVAHMVMMRDELFDR